MNLETAVNFTEANEENEDAGDCEFLRCGNESSGG
jgi:hypothetical protein